METDHLLRYPLMKVLSCNVDFILIKKDLWCPLSQNGFLTTSFFSNLLACADGEVILMNGSLPSVGEGRVEICYNNTYWTICDDFWDEIAADVVCQQLNFTGSCKF